MFAYKYNTDHERLNHHANTRLYHHDEYSLGTFLGGVSGAVSDSLLRFNREQNSAYKRLQSIDAGDVVLVRGGEVAMQIRDHVPGGGKEQPAGDEAERKHHNVVAPLEVNQRREQVGEVAAPTLRYVAARYVYVAVLEEQPLLLLLLVGGGGGPRRYGHLRVARQRLGFQLLVGRQAEWVVVAHNSHRFGAFGHCFLQHAY